MSGPSQGYPCLKSPSSNYSENNYNEATLELIHRLGFTQNDLILKDTRSLNRDLKVMPLTLGSKSKSSYPQRHRCRTEEIFLSLFTKYSF